MLWLLFPTGTVLFYVLPCRSTWLSWEWNTLGYSKCLIMNRQKIKGSVCLQTDWCARSPGNRCIWKKPKNEWYQRNQCEQSVIGERQRLCCSRNKAPSVRAELCVISLLLIHVVMFLFIEFDWYLFNLENIDTLFIHRPTYCLKADYSARKMP